MERYAELFLDAAERAGDSVLVRATGYRLARVLVFTPNVRRRDVLAETIQQECERIGIAELAGRFWMVAMDDLLSANTGNGFDESMGQVDAAGLHSAVWRVAGSVGNVPLLRSKELHSTGPCPPGPSSAEPNSAEKE